MSILVTTPTGDVGSNVVQQLTDKDAAFGVFARTPDKLSDAVHEHATVHQGDLEDADALADVLVDYDVLFAVIPPNMGAQDWPAWMRRIADNYVAALQHAGVGRVVLLSSAGAQLDDLGPISQLGYAEQRLRDVAADVAMLRAGYFMENLFANLDTIARENTIYGGFSPDMPIPYVATRDIGAVAARWLLDDDWTGAHVVGIHGPEDITLAEVTRILSDVLDRDVRFVQVPTAAIVGVFQEMGATPSVAETYGEMIDGLKRHGLAFRAEARTPATTTPTTMRQFAEDTLEPALAATG